MYICEKCGEVFEEPRVIGSDADRGECCPNCGCDYFDEAVQCKVCGEWVAESDTEGGYHSEVCKDCIKSRRKDIDFLLKTTSRFTDSVEIPDLFAYVLDEDEIKKVVYEALYNRVIQGIIRDSYPWHDPKLDEINTDDFVRYYGSEIAEAMVDELEGKEGAA